MTTFTVNRAKWRCGWGNTKSSHGQGESRLLNKEGFMCCLGFVCRQKKVPAAKIRCVRMPDCLGVTVSRPLDGLLVTHEKPFFPFDSKKTQVKRSSLSALAADINDDGSITRKQRERKLATLFKDHGHKMVFTGEYTKP